MSLHSISLMPTPVKELRSLAMPMVATLMVVTLKELRSLAMPMLATLMVVTRISEIRRNRAVPTPETPETPTILLATSEL